MSTSYHTLLTARFCFWEYHRVRINVIQSSLIGFLAQAYQGSSSHRIGAACFLLSLHFASLPTSRCGSMTDITNAENVPSEPQARRIVYCGGEPRQESRIKHQESSIKQQESRIIAPSPSPSYHMWWQTLKRFQSLQSSPRGTFSDHCKPVKTTHSIEK